ncbi:MAG TPA: ABC transporter substrate-binding protein [Roseiflexaceae bacterium]|nr:ABC transporter substrate-binding protein [Roseiflexaceae bacterium]
MKRMLVLVLTALLLAACGTTGPTGQADAPTAPAATAAPDAVAPTAALPDAPAPTAQQSGKVVSNVTVGLDWTPNTNHTGLYVARDNGYYRETALEVEIVQAQEGGTVEQLVAAGRLDFGISYQEGVTQARVEGLPIVSVAAVIQHNTSGFASRADLGIKTPKDFEGKKYGAYGSPVERAVIQGLMECAGADVEKVQFVDIGSTDFFVATERGDVDFAWIFQGWTGMEAASRGVALNTVMMNELNCVPDYYTPVLITSEKLIAERPNLVRDFVQATARGYQFAIAGPDEAADLLLAAAPELDADLVRRSQRYLAAQYQADAPRWGEQKLEIWRGYAQWMADRQLITSMIEPEKAFTNQFLP